MDRFVASVLTALTLGFGTARIVAGDDLAVGAEVRATTPERTVTGILAAITERTFVVRANDAPVEIPRAQLRKLEVLNPGRSVHLAIWGGSGVILGGVLGYSAAFNFIDACNALCRQQQPKFAVVGGLGLGAAGLILGEALVRKPHWEEVDLPAPKVRVGITPNRGHGVRAAVACSF